MGAGGSDYGGLAQGQIGQGFAQGVDAATENYLKYKKLIEERAQREFNNNLSKYAIQAQQNELALKYIDSALASIVKGKPMPDPETATSQELDEWLSGEQAKYAQIPALIKAYEEVFKKAGIEVDPQTYVNSFFGGDPTKLLSQQRDRVVATQNYRSLLPKAEELKKTAAELGAKYGYDSKEYKDAFNAYLDVINKPDAALGISLAEAYERATGRKYVDPTANPAAFQQSARTTLVNNNVKDRLAALATQRPEAQAVLAQVEQGGLEASSVIDTPNGKMTVLEFVNSFVKVEDLKKLINSGSPEDLDKAMNIIFTMSAEDRAKLPEEIREAWTIFSEYQSGKRAADDSVYSRAVTISRLPKLDYETKVATKENIQTNTNVKLKELGLAEDAALSQMARDINNGVNVLTETNKARFFSKLPEGMSEEDKEKAWEEFAIKPYLKAKEKDDLQFRSLQNQVTAKAMENINAESSLVTSGGLYLVATNLDGTIDYSSPAYQLYAKGRGGDTDAVRRAFADLIERSKYHFDQIDETRRTSLENGKLNNRILNADADYKEWATPYQRRLLQANVRTTESQARVQTGTEQAQIDSATAGARSAQANADVAERTVDARVNNTKADARTAEANANVAERTVDARVSNANASARSAKAEADVAERTVDARVSSYKSDAVVKEIQAEVARASKTGRIAATFQETADALGEDWLNSGEPERLFGQYMTPAQIQSARKVAGVRISLRKEADNLAILDQYIKNPQVWYKQPAKLREVALRAGIDPGEFVARITYLASVRNKLSDLEVQQVKTSIWASKKNVQISQAHLNLAELNRQDGNARWLAEWERDRERYADARRFRDRQFNRDTAQQEISNFMRLVELEQSGRSLTIQQQSIVAQFKGVVLPTIIEANRTEKANIENYTAQIEELIGNNPYIRQLANQIDPNKRNAQGQIILPAGVSPQHASLLSQIARLKALRADSQRALNNTNALLSQVSNSMMNSGFSIEDLIGDGQNPQNYITAGNLRIPVGANKTSVVAALDSYNGTTAASRAFISGVKRVLVGQSGGGDEIYQPGWCGRFVKTVIKENFNLPAGVNIAANAYGIYQSLVKAGMGVNNGKPITDVSQLQEGMVLWQDSPDRDAQGNAVGHIAIYAGGKIWHNSYYNDNKVNGAVGWMEPEQFLKAYKTYGALLPSRLAKEGYQGDTVSIPPKQNTPPGKSPTVTPPKTPPLKYADDKGNFAPSVNLAALTKGKGREVTKPTNGGPLQVNIGNGSFRQLDNPQVANNVMAIVGTQAVQYFDSMAVRKGSLTFRELAQQNPNAAIEAVVNILKSPLPQGGVLLSGDLEPYVLRWLKSKGIIK